jgi:hypothetical protein
MNFMQFFFLLPVLGLDVVTSESLFGYESASKDMLAVIAEPDISGERIVLPDTSQFLQPAIQVSKRKNSSQFFLPTLQMCANEGVLSGMLYVAYCSSNQLLLCLQLSAPTPLGMGSKPFTGAAQNSPMIVFPKYNNYLLDRDKFDINSRILVPLHLLGIKSLQQGNRSYRL